MSKAVMAVVLLSCVSVCALADDRLDAAVDPCVRLIVQEAISGNSFDESAVIEKCVADAEKLGYTRDHIFFYMGGKTVGLMMMTGDASRR